MLRVQVVQCLRFHFNIRRPYKRITLSCDKAGCNATSIHDSDACVIARLYLVQVTHKNGTFWSTLATYLDQNLRRGCTDWTACLPEVAGADLVLHAEEMIAR